MTLTSSMTTFPVHLAVFHFQTHFMYVFRENKEFLSELVNGSVQHGSVLARPSSTGTHFMPDVLLKTSQIYSLFLAHIVRCGQQEPRDDRAVHLSSRPVRLASRGQRQELSHPPYCPTTSRVSLGQGSEHEGLFSRSERLRSGCVSGCDGARVCMIMSSQVGVSVHVSV